MLSIIVCTYNRAAMLERALAAICTQSLDQKLYELIVVDDGSTDDTEKVCMRFQDQLSQFIYHRQQENLGLATARNRGVAIASGDKIIFTDDDCIPQSDWAENLSKTLDDYPAVTGGIIPATDTYLGFTTNIVHFSRSLSFRKPGRTCFATGANMGFRKTVLEELSGFNEHFTFAEDTQFGLRVQEKGYVLYFDPDSAVTHSPRMRSLASILKYSYIHAKTTIQLRERYKNILNSPWILRSPIAMVLLSPLIALKSTIDSYRGCPLTFWYLSTIPVTYFSKISWCLGAARQLTSNTHLPEL